MKIVVTGAAGFVGAATASRLLDDGHDVIGIDCYLPDLYPADTKRARLDGVLGRSGFTFVEADLRHVSIAPHLDDVDVLVNLAAMPGLTSSWVDFKTYVDCNTTLTQRLLSDLRLHPEVHFVQASTSSVYGLVAEGDESCPLSPVSPYGVTKLAAEQLVAAFRASFGLRATTLRYFSVYGPSQRPDQAYSVFCRDLLSGSPLRVTGNGRQSRSSTYIGDVVEATVRACEQRPDGAVLNVCGGEEIVLLDAIDVIADELGVTPRIDFVADRPGDQRRTCGDSSRACEVLGWSPAMPIDAGIRLQARAAAADAERALAEALRA